MISSQHHQRKVEAVARQVKAFAHSGQPVRFVKRSVSHVVPNPFASQDNLEPVDLTPLDQILEIDPERRVAVAESGVTFESLVRATLKHGLMPITVPELRGITIGGAVSGCSVESLSYRYGGFHDSCLEYEVVTATGEVLTVSPEKNGDIFAMVHGSYGTLAIITSLTFRLLPAKPFVRLDYVTLPGREEFWAYLQGKITPQDHPHQFVDAIVHGPDRFVVCLGTLVDQAPSVSSYEGLDIYYHSTARRTVDHLAAEEYFFRYDRECHWLSRTVPLLETRPGRWLLGRHVLGSTNLITWSQRLSPLFRLRGRPDVVVDVFIPARRFEEFFRWYEETMDFWPLWVVPYRAPTMYPWIADGHAELMGQGLYMDCAIYGKANRDPHVDWSEVLERKVHELGGIKTLISRNHYTPETFWSIYSKPRWEAIKARTDPRNILGGLYERLVGH